MNKFKIIIPCYQTENWIEKCLESLMLQTYTNWEAVVINDASTDSTLDKIIQFIKNNELNDKIRVFNRTNNVGALENIVYGISSICKSGEDIIVLLDGDDWFYTDLALEYVNSIYENEEVWLTHGQYITLSSNHLGNNKRIKDTRNYRKCVDWCSSHLRTFKYKIWKLINDKDLRDNNNQYYKMGWDLSIMYPLIEMCGLNKIRFIDKVLYVYNDTNPINDFRKDAKFQISCDKEIRSKKSYNEIALQQFRLVSHSFGNRSAGNGTLDISPNYFCWNRENEYKDICFFTDDKLLSISSVNSKSKINIAWLIEPPSVQSKAYEWIKSNYKLFDYVLTHNKELLIDKNFVWYPHGGTWIYPNDMKVYDKNKNISAIVSSKTLTEGHRLRHLALAKFGDKIDFLCGRGYLSIDYKLEALKDFRYSLVVENGKFDTYFTEKIIDCFVTGTIPIYWGCSLKNIFNEKGILYFSDLNQLETILNRCSEEDYMNRINAVTDNFELAKQYINMENWIYKNFISKIKI